MNGSFLSLLNVLIIPLVVYVVLLEKRMYRIQICLKALCRKNGIDENGLGLKEGL